MEFCMCRCTASSLRRLELPVMALKHGKDTVTLAKAQNPAPGMLDHARGLEHHLLHHRPDAMALSGMALRPVRLIEGNLPIHSHQIHRHSNEMAHQVVGVLHARGQPF